MKISVGSVEFLVFAVSDSAVTVSRVGDLDAGVATRLWQPVGERPAPACWRLPTQLFEGLVFLVADTAEIEPRPAMMSIVVDLLLHSGYLECREPVDSKRRFRQYPRTGRGADRPPCRPEGKKAPISKIP